MFHDKNLVRFSFYSHFLAGTAVITPKLFTVISQHAPLGDLMIAGRLSAILMSGAAAVAVLDCKGIASGRSFKPGAKGGASGQNACWTLKTVVEDPFCGMIW
jgi:hypothetical protein